VGEVSRPDAITEIRWAILKLFASSPSFHFTASILWEQMALEINANRNAFPTKPILVSRSPAAVHPSWHTPFNMESRPRHHQLWGRESRHYQKAGWLYFQHMSGIRTPVGISYTISYNVSSIRDRLCGQSSWLQIRRPGFDSRHYQKKK
jgi:hypothetical protein